ncbi:hypothetical protein ACLOJK_027757 [Asimina triloba]
MKKCCGCGKRDWTPSIAIVIFSTGFSVFGLACLAASCLLRRRHRNYHSNANAIYLTKILGVEMMLLPWLFDSLLLLAVAALNAAGIYDASWFFWISDDDDVDVGRASATATPQSCSISHLKMKQHATCERVRRVGDGVHEAVESTTMVMMEGENEGRELLAMTATDTDTGDSSPETYFTLYVQGRTSAT